MAVVTGRFLLGAVKAVPAPEVSIEALATVVNDGEYSNSKKLGLNWAIKTIAF
jgi:hypothetical protein